MRRSRPPAGVLVVNKPSGPSSRRIVDRVVRVLGTRKVGHAGTLDPFADGLLLVAWEKATALVPYLQSREKTYRAVVRFGRETDTQDRTGKIVSESDPGGLTTARIESALPGFRGRIRQTPPAYSALKKGGERLYRLARRGEPAIAETRERDVFRFELVEWNPPLGLFEISCSAGTYVRTLAHDLGKVLGTGASLDVLTRSAIGVVSLDDSVPGDKIPELGREELLSLALSPADAVPELPAVYLTADEAKLVAVGGWRDPQKRLSQTQTYRLLDAEGSLLALASGGDNARLLRVFCEGTA